MRVLEFAITTAIIYVVYMSLAFWAATVVSGRLAEVFETLNSVCP